MARAASEVAGGPAGRHVAAAGSGWWTSGRVLCLLTVPTMVLAVLTRQHCRTSLWSSPDQFTHACYSDLPAWYLSSGLDRGVVPLLEAADGTYLAQPVGTGGLLWFLAQLAQLAPMPLAGPDGARAVFDLGAVLLAVALVGTVLAVHALAGRRPWDAALVALSPVVVVAGLVSLDLVAVALATGGLLALARRHPVAAGVLLGLAVAVRPLALLVVVAVWLVALRTGRRRPAVLTSVAAAGTWVALNLPVLLLSPQGWTAYWASLVQAPPGYGSLWLLPQLAGHPVDAGLARWLSFSAIGAVVVGAAVLARGARRRPGLPTVLLVLVAGVLAVSLSVPVQASLWLLPFAALAVPRWRDHLVWAAAEVAYATGTWLYLYGQSVPERGMAPWAYGLLLVLRLGAMGWLARQAVRAAPDRPTTLPRSSGRA